MIRKKPKLKPATISRRFKKIMDNYWKRLNELEKERRAALIELQNRCAHERVHHHIDPAGGNDDWFECIDCHVEVFL